ncbi:hypothetical protein AB1Y20_006369 [Prymnesium parvum]|uniref:Uncharacterized protein n=1 Tax=Prymnesium parvum TaxID=97485 RepID=A0AB34J3W8_PRYPA
MRWDALDAAATGCRGSTYTERSSYGAAASRWGHVMRGGWRGAVLGPGGDKIYGIPTNASSVLEIDPMTRTISTFGHVGDREPTLSECAGALHCGEEKWIGGVLTASGKILGIPYAAESVLEIDPVARTATTFGVVSSTVKRKWVEGVLGANNRVYGIPYDADVVLEIDPENHALFIFGSLSRFGDSCKWYGGVLGPNGKIYAIPYSAPYVLEIDTDRRTAEPFAMTQTGWGKWAGGVLAGNGKIYGVPALAKGVLEIDVEQRLTNLYGMLPAGKEQDDKWNGAVLAPNGKMYGIPWRSSKVLEFDPATKAIALLGSLTATNFTWHGGALAKDGRIVAVPYNSPWVLEIGESVCSVPTPANARLEAVSPQTAREVLQQPAAPLADPQQQRGVLSEALSRGSALSPSKEMQFVLALLGCPEAAKASEDACFHLSHRTWHSAMITIMKPGSMLVDIREQAVVQSRLSHLPTNFCFLFNGHPLDPNVEASMKAVDVAVSHEAQYILLIDNVHCNIAPEGGAWPSRLTLLLPSAALLLLGVAAALLASSCLRRMPRGHADYEKVPLVAHPLEGGGKRVPCLRPPCLHPRLRSMFAPLERKQRAHPLPRPEACEEAAKDAAA